MDDEGRFSNLPSGIESGATAASQYVAEPRKAAQGIGGGSVALWAIALISLLLSASALFIAINGQSSLSASTRADLREMADDLRAIQQKDITLSSPLKATAYVEQSFPASDIFPSKFDMPLEGQIVLDQRIEAHTANGNVVPLFLNSTIPLSFTVPVESNKSLSSVRLTIKKEVPIDTRLSATMKVQAVYGKELNGIIDKLEKMSEAK